MSTQCPSERANTVKNKVEHTNVNRVCSNSTMVHNASTEQRERNEGISTSSQLHQEVEIILMDEIEESDVEVENTEVAQPPPQMMDATCSTSAVSKQSTPDVESSKRKRDSTNMWNSKDLEQKEQTPVASTSTQLQSELGNIVKKEIEEMEVEHNGLKDSAQQRMGEDCTRSAVSEQAQMRKSKRKRTKVQGSGDPTQQSQQPPSEQPSKKVCVSRPLRPHEKYLEGCLVMAEGPYFWKGHPYWPAIIRKPGPDFPKHPEYFQIHRGKILFYIQYFTDPSISCWQKPGKMRLFNAAKPRPSRCNIPNPKIVAEFEEGIRIAKAASKFTVEDRLAKFTLPDKASTDSLLKTIEEWESQVAPRVCSVAQLENNRATPTERNGRICADSIIQEEGEPTPPTDTNGESITEVVAQNEIAPAPLAKANGESFPDSAEVEIMKKRISKHKQKLRDEGYRQRDEEFKKLTADNAALKAIVDQKTKDITVLQKDREKEKLEYEKEIELKKQEVLKYKQEAEKWKAFVNEMLNDW